MDVRSQRVQDLPAAMQEVFELDETSEEEEEIPTFTLDSDLLDAWDIFRISLPYAHELNPNAQIIIEVAKEKNLILSTLLPEIALIYQGYRENLPNER